MGKKAVVFANGDLLLFKTVMDNRLAWLTEKHSVAVSKKVQPWPPGPAKGPVCWLLAILLLAACSCQCEVSQPGCSSSALPAAAQTAEVQASARR